MVRARDLEGCREVEELGLGLLVARPREPEESVGADRPVVRARELDERVAPPSELGVERERLGGEAADERVRVLERDPLDLRHELGESLVPDRAEGVDPARRVRVSKTGDGERHARAPAYRRHGRVVARRGESRRRYDGGTAEGWLDPGSGARGGRGSVDVRRVLRKWGGGPERGGWPRCCDRAQRGQVAPLLGVARRARREEDEPTRAGYERHRQEERRGV